MKHLLFTIALVALPLLLSAQSEGNHQKREGKEHMKIENLVTDLTSTQRTRIDIITRRSRKTVELYRSQLHAVRDSIRSYMSSQEDHSAVLFPLYEREGMLQTEISKEYYRTKVAIDDVLTPEQYRQVTEKMEQNRRNKAGKTPAHSPSSQKKQDNRIPQTRSDK
ncbi:MAG: hypothetical protein K6D59_05555 [Bacteroidales bacterium]|nr:hypothetical protein [Bacteroidales bacterium]